MHRPVLDTTSEFDINMVEGDPISFAWIIEGEDWSGAYTFNCSTPDGLVTVAATGSVVGTDTLFSVSSAANAFLVPTSSGFAWSLKANAGITRFKGLLFVEAKVA